MIGTGARVPRRGEIWYGHIPGGEDDPHRPRPLLVVSEDRRNMALEHALVVPLFSRGNLGPTRLPIQRGVGGVPHDSVLFCEEITRMPYRYLEQGPLGMPVPAELLDEIVVAVRRALGDVA